MKHDLMSLWCIRVWFYF